MSAPNVGLPRFCTIPAARTDAYRQLGRGQRRPPYAHGPGKVLGVARNQRFVIEADVMSYVRSHGYPAPEVYDAGDGYLVMERVDGPTMLKDAVPFRIGRYRSSWRASTSSCIASPRPRG